MLDNLSASLTRHPRELYVLYYTPELASLLDERRFLERIGTGEEFVAWRSRAS
jgi:hypothetical protein